MSDEQARADLADTIETVRDWIADKVMGWNGFDEEPDEMADALTRVLSALRTSTEGPTRVEAVADLVDASEQLQSALHDQEWPTVQVTDCMGSVRDALDNLAAPTRDESSTEGGAWEGCVERDGIVVEPAPPSPTEQEGEEE